MNTVTFLPQVEKAGRSILWDNSTAYPAWGKRLHQDPHEELTRLILPAF